MDLKSILGVMAVIAAILQYTPYIIDVLNRKTRPHVFSWFVWGLPCGIVFAAQLIKGGGAGSWATGVTAILCTVIFILSLFHGEREITRLDRVSFFIALVAIALWAITKDPLGSVVLITVADILGFIPTIRKSITKPHEETMSTYGVGSLKWLLSLPALETFSLTTSLYPIAMMLANGALVVLLAQRRKN